MHIYINSFTFYSTSMPKLVLKFNRVPLDSKRDSDQHYDGFHYGLLVNLRIFDQYLQEKAKPISYIIVLPHIFNVQYNKRPP